MKRRFHAALCALVVFSSLGQAQPARAARAITNLHTLDAYFALYAPDSNVPWKPATVRLETYTSAAVNFAVYQVDPGDVLTAGTNARPRAVDTRHMRPIARWKFTPAGGYQFQSNEINVPLGNREGFFVVEAQRGNVGEQVWINRTRVGMLTQQTPGDVLIYGADLGTGRPLSGMRVQFLVNNNFETRSTDSRGIVRWSGRSHPVFALAQWGSSYAFTSLLPQAPVPTEIVGVRVESAVAHAGDRVRVIGFARSRAGGQLRVASGNVQISVRNGATLIGERSVHLDQAGAFTTSFTLPANAPAGDYAILAQAGSGIGAATLHVDANAGGLALRVAPRCEGACDPNADVPVSIEATRDGHAAAGVPVEVSVVRSPHAATLGRDGDRPWGIAQWLDTTVTTGADGRATVMIPHPTDDLASTYGVRVSSAGTNADTRFVVSTGNAVVLLTLDRDTIASGSPLGFYVTATDGGGHAIGGTVTVQAQQGQSVQQQVVNLDAGGRGRGSFSSLPLGTSMVLAQITANGTTASDAAQVTVSPQLATDPSNDSSANVRAGSDRSLYHAGDNVVVNAGDSGSVGNALVTLQSIFGSQVAVPRTNGGSANASFRASAVPGSLRAVAAFVRDGTLEWNATSIALDAPGRPVATTLTLDKPNYGAGETALAQLGQNTPGTVVVRVSQGEPSGGASFDSLADALAIDVASTQTSASSDITWHAGVDSTGNHAQAFNYSRRTAPPADVTLAQADSQTVFWSVERSAGAPIAVPVPGQRGRYTLTILKIDDDGRISTATSNLVVR